MANPFEMPYMKKKLREEESPGESLPELVEAEKGRQKKKTAKKAEEDFFEEKVAEGEIAEARHRRIMDPDWLKGKLSGLDKGRGKKEGEPATEAAGEIEAVEKKEPPPTPAEKVIVEMQEEPVYELTKKKKSAPVEAVESKEKNNFDPEKMSLTELDDRVQEMWKAMGKIIEDAAAFKPSKEEKKKLKRFTKKGGEWPLDDAVTEENFGERLKKYGIAEYINPSQIEEDRDPYAVVSKQYGIYRDALEGRIRKIKLKQLEEAEGKPKTKEEKAERAEEVEVEIEAELPPQPPEYEDYKVEAGTEDTDEKEKEMEVELPAEGEGMPWELKRKLGEEIEVGGEDIVGTEDLDAAQIKEIRENLEEPEEEQEKTVRKPEKKEKGIRKKKMRVKRMGTGPGADVLGIGEFLREEAKEHEKKIGLKPKPKAEKKKGFFARLFGGK